MKINMAQLEQDFTMLDALANYIVRHLEDAASDDRATRRRFGSLVALLAERAEQCAPLPSHVSLTE